MNTVPTIGELREFHKRSTYFVIQALLQGVSAPHGWWLYSQGGNAGTHPLTDADRMAVFVEREDSPEGAVRAMAVLARSYLVAGGAMRSTLAAQGAPLPRAIVVVAPPAKAVEGEVVKTFVITEHQTFLAESPVVDGGKAVKLGDLELLDVSLTHNQRPSQMN
uniref:hypothetical protein n=1 Tax=Burkholderia sp. M701 TaxID=326454 RepID=UPI0012EB6E9E|nr:hypothetical protein [Burkholderia sp. M701]